MALLSSAPLAATALIGAMPVAIMAGGFLARKSDTSSFRSYLLGLMLPALGALPCIYGGCPELPEVPAIALIGAAGFWLTFEVTVLRGIWTIDGGFLVAFAPGFVIAIAAVLVALS